MVDVAWAQGGGEAASQPSTLIQVVMPFVFIFVIFYFLLIRPQVKKQKALSAMIANLKKGDRVVTNGGICGVVVGTKEDAIVLKVAENTKIEVVKSAVASLRGSADHEST
ncbi:MAG: preprotein translocase subunit YajC [Candidatus Eiseniibacteriota bacterium]|jgi:preprotein translocase subunit YajC